MEKLYNEVEKDAYQTLVLFGLPEAIARDCIASRNTKELEVVIEFLARYGNYIIKDK
ncbi:hypothetical protein [Lysinibacillus fusiformis]|uniref:hypothetical protein n=1 Tax=Lysinibacillus fusiformis TaxID=28031 RepID=UPI001ABF5C37|nr:hypothetical protein [Lysinibacillus fusiformis]